MSDWNHRECTIDRPVLSVCIPTFNRAESLEFLLENLDVIKKKHGNAIQICVSNNQSTDMTADVIRRWSDSLDLCIVTQAENIGATRNFFAVSRMAMGKWIMIVGDDDSIIPENFNCLFDCLMGSDENDWVLAGVAGSNGEEYLLGSLAAGHYDAKSIRKRVLQTGLYRYGFIGMHIFPSALKDEFVSLSLEQAQPWPHLALFLRYIQRGHVQVFTPPVVQQAGGGSALFWAISDMAHIKLRKLNIIAEARVSMFHNRYYADLLLLRELYLARDIRTLLFWKALKPNDFNCRALHEYATRYGLLRPPFRFLAVFHGIVLFIAYILPAPVMRILLCLIGQRGWMASYEKNKQVMSAFNGIKRGV